MLVTVGRLSAIFNLTMCPPLYFITSFFNVLADANTCTHRGTDVLYKWMMCIQYFSTGRTYCTLLQARTHIWFDMWKGDRSLMANSFKCKLNFPLTPCHGYIICLFSEGSSNRSSTKCMCFNWCSHVWVRLATVASQILFLHFKMALGQKTSHSLKL